MAKILGGKPSMPSKPASFKPTYKSGSGVKKNAFGVNAPAGKATTATKGDASNTYPGRRDNDVSNPSGLRGRESLAAYARGRSYGE
jgi:hypothetical protein